MGYTVSQICNLALTHIGNDTITDINDTADSNARICKLFYEPTRDLVLREYPWNFAKRVKLGVAIAGVTVPGWTYFYAIPSECLFIRAIYNTATYGAASPDKYEKMLNPDTNTLLIATNTENAYIEYTAAVTDPNLFEPAFVKALAYRLAAEIAEKLTGKGAIVNRLFALYKEQISTSATLNANEGHPDQPLTNSYADARL
jgi:hypothetical protein